MPFFLLFRQREEHAQHGRQILLDVGGDDAPERCARLAGLDALIERRQDDDRLRGAGVHRLLELALGVDRILRRHDRTQLPRRQLRDDELWAIGQQQRDAIAFLDPFAGERVGQRVASAVELPPAERTTLEQHGRLLAALVGVLCNEVDERFVGIRADRTRDSRIVVIEPRLVHGCLPCKTAG